ncbi:serine/threonine-protein kinase-like protein CCR4 [Musa acuminata AAA Group]|uniref:serine/threonine-protein kinase-like protein CCR4 n=1 Tax=Musa acuminata AAA Group TaxID=214697 RepID=UPI0031D73B86
MKWSLVSAGFEAVTAASARPFPSLPPNLTQHTTKGRFFGDYCYNYYSPTLCAPPGYDDILHHHIAMPPSNPTKSLPLFLLLVFLLLLCVSTPPSVVASSPPFSTLAVSHSSNVTLVCALVPSAVAYKYDICCTNASNRSQSRLYESPETPYAAVAAGNGFLCGLTVPADGSNATMRWWAFHENEIYEKRVYWGTPLTALASGDNHVCGLIGGAHRPRCWRWEEMRVPAGMNFSEIAVGRNFVCGRLGCGAIRCFGNDTVVVRKVPVGNFSMVAAGSRHACGVFDDGRLTCWGTGAPEVPSDPLDIVSMALGESKTCVLRSNGTVRCWGEGSRPPDFLAGEQFIGIQARGDTLCGILMFNFSVVCWGNEEFRRNHTMYGRVLPGTCTPTSICTCGFLAGSGNMCPSEEGICQSCKFQLSSNSSTSPQQASRGSKKRILLVAVLGSVGFGLALLALLSFLVSLALKKQSNGWLYDTVQLGRWRRTAAAALSSQMETFLDGQVGGGTVEEFSLQFLAKITNNFSEAHKIGSGSFGAVYRATLPGGRDVAIKRADVPAAAAPSTSRRHEQLRLRDEHQRERAFYSELALLSRVNHKNLLRLLGFCRERGERVLVYEYMTNGTLHDNLHRRPMTPPSPLSSWTARLRLALDAARGIEYLHAYAVPAIIHRDIKSSNILLDAEWTAKVADFGLSLTSPDDEGSVAAGTLGYMDPEYYRLRRLTEKSDVYSFGVVLLELVTGCKAIHRSQQVAGSEEGDEAEEAEGSATPRNVVEMAVPYIEADDIARVMDRRVAQASAEEVEAVAYVGYVAAECVRAEGQERPTMGEVVGALERAVAACGGAYGPDRVDSRSEPTGGRRALSRAPSFL